MMSVHGMYDKANSILDIRGATADKMQVLSRIEGLRAEIDQLQETDPAKRAFRDLFIGSSDSGARFALRDHVIEEIGRISDDEVIRYLRYRYAYEVFPADKVVRKYPPLVQIEPSSICNYRCVFCYQADSRLSDKRHGHMGVMPIELFREIIDEIEGEVEAISLASRGEPTVNKQLPEMLAYVSGKFLATKVNTNAYLLDQKMARAILDADIQTLVFSADAATEPLYSKLRVNGNLERVMHNIELFNEIKQREYPHSRMITRVSGVRYSDEQNLDEMEGYWKSYVDQVTFVDYNPWGNVYEAEKKGIDEPCSDLWRRLFVWWDGRVAPCDVDYLTTLSEEKFPSSSISEIWNGEMYQSLRERHMNGERQQLEPCSRCVVV